MTRSRAEIIEAIANAETVMNQSRYRTQRLMAQAVADALRWVIQDEADRVKDLAVDFIEDEGDRINVAVDFIEGNKT